MRSDGWLDEDPTISPQWVVGVCGEVVVELDIKDIVDDLESWILTAIVTH